MEVRVADRPIGEILDVCERYWADTRVPRRAATEMRAELEGHLSDAQAEGKPIESVVGDDVLDFAELWARVHRAPVMGRAVRHSHGPAWLHSRWTLTALLAAAVAVIAVALVLGPREESMDAEVWRWVWVAATVILAVGEIITAGFFMLPFAVGTAVAAFLAFLNVAVPLQFIALIIVSILSLIGLQRFARRDDDFQPAVGANRYIDKRATVLEAVNRIDGTGRVRMDTEQWRATTDDDATIPEGVEVRVVDVRGTRLVVEVLD